MQSDNDILSNEELKQKALVALRRRPLTNRYLGRAAQRRLSCHKWLESNLIQALIEDNEPLLGRAEDLLKHIYLGEPDLLEELTASLTGGEKDFDAQFGDLWAELRAAKQLIYEGAENLSKIPRTNVLTPDFEYRYKDRPYLAEVKNLRSPTSLQELLDIKLRAIALLQPGIFEGVRLHFDLHAGEFGETWGYPDAKTECDAFVDKIYKAVIGGIRREVHVLHEVRRLSQRVHLSVKLQRSRSHSVIFTLGPQGYCLSDSERAHVLVDPLERKISSVVNTAFSQLNTFRTSEEIEGRIMLNWQKPAVFEWDESLQRRVRAIVQDLADRFAGYDSNISVCLISDPSG